MKHPSLQPTLKDIARATNLTVASVSRILAGKAKFSDETRERVEAVANALGYRPNRLVSGIQTGRTGLIGTILPIHSEWGAQLLTGLQRELALHGYVPIALDCPSTSINELEMIYHLLDRRVEGIVLFPGDDTISDEYFDEIYSRKIPLVVVVRRLTRAHCHFVGCDDFQSGKLAAEHLTGLGHRVLGHIGGPWNISTGRERAEGFNQTAMSQPVLSDSTRRLMRAEGFTQTAMSQQGVSIAQVVMPTFLPDEALIEQFLDAHPQVTGIFCANEPIAFGLYAVAKRRKLNIPGDLSIVSHGNGRAASIVSPPLTSTLENSIQIGREAASLLLELTSNKKPPLPIIEKRIPVELIIRDSTAPVPLRSA
jgi:LacI family transcriptional regulator